MMRGGSAETAEVCVAQVASSKRVPVSTCSMVTAGAETAEACVALVIVVESCIEVTVSLLRVGGAETQP